MNYLFTTCHHTKPSTPQPNVYISTWNAVHFATSRGKVSKHYFFNGLFPRLKCPSCLLQYGTCSVKSLWSHSPSWGEKPRSCHGSWTEAGMHITILERETGGGDVVKIIILLQPELFWTFISRTLLDYIKEQIKAFKLTEKGRNVADWETQELIAMWLVFEITIYCWYFCFITLVFLYHILLLC